MPTTIKLKNSVTTTNTPTSLAQGEVAINITDKKVWVGNAATTPIQLLGAGSSASFGALTCTSLTNSGLTSGRVTYATTAGLLTDSANMTFNGTTLTVADFTDSSLTANRVVYATTAGNLTTSANLTFNGTTLTTVNDASISGLTVGKGGGAVANNTAVGGGSLGANTSGDYNSAFGRFSLPANTTGQQNIAFGYQALSNNTSGSYNGALGLQALYQNTTGGYNIAIGNQALQANTTASNNTAVGYQALYNNTTNSNSTAVGQGALQSSTGYENTAIGKNSGNSTTSGYSNVYVGHQSGNWNVNHTTGYESIFIGNKTSPAAGSDSNTIVIGAGTTNGKGSTTGFINAGGGGVYQGNNSTLWSITSDQRLKKNIVDNNVGLEKITQIKVRNFEYRKPEEVTELDPSNAIQIEGLQLGAIAQELKEVLPDCVKTESTGVMSVDASNLTWYLVNAIKELKAEIDQLKGVIND